MNMTLIDTEAFKKAGLTDEEIESVKIWIQDVKSGNTISHDELKAISRKKIFSKSKLYA